METKKQFFRAYVQEQDEDWFEDLAERMSFDLGEAFDMDSVVPAMEEFLDSKVITTRGPYVSWLSQCQKRLD